MEIIELQPHFSYYLSTQCNKSIFKLERNDLMPKFGYLHNEYLSQKKYLKHDKFSYTVVDTESLTDKSTQFSMHAPIKIA